jgi:hypothetical protein
MTRFCWLLLLGLAFPLVGHAGNIYKCTGGGREIAYQNFPCANGLDQTLMASSSQPAYWAAPNTYSAPQTTRPAVYAALPQHLPGGLPESRPAMPFQRTTLALGMTDDEVLNLPHWGLPAKIVRSKANHLWREEWLYMSHADGAKRLYFENTRLIAVEDAPAPLQQVASVTTVRSY